MVKYQDPRVTRLIKSRFPQTGDGCPVGICENEGDDLIGVGIQKCFDGLQVIHNETAIEESL